MNFTVVGPGAIGSLWASYLKDAGHHISLWSRQTANQIVIKRDHCLANTFTNNDPSSVMKADVILVTLKAPIVEQVLTQMKSYINSDAIIVLMHNGMGTAEAIKTHLPDNPLLLATTTHGAYRPSSDLVSHSGRGKTLLGAANQKGQQCEFLVEVLNHALADVAWHHNIDQALWNKLAINCAINPLTAIHQIRNGELAQPQYHAQLTAIVSEVCAVINAQGFKAEENNLRQIIDEVILATSQNFSSMEQDIAHQRPSEIDFITGYVVKCAHQHNIAVPANQALYNAVKQIEQRW